MFCTKVKRGIVLFFKEKKGCKSTTLYKSKLIFNASKIALWRKKNFFLEQNYILDGTCWSDWEGFQNKMLQSIWMPGKRQTFDFYIQACLKMKVIGHMNVSPP